MVGFVAEWVVRVGRTRVTDNDSCHFVKLRVTREIGSPDIISGSVLLFHAARALVKTVLMRVEWMPFAGQPHATEYHRRRLLHVAKHIHVAQLISAAYTEVVCSQHQADGPNRVTRATERLHSI